jgi:hypothetical protein
VPSLFFRQGEEAVYLSRCFDWCLEQLKCYVNKVIMRERNPKHVNSENVDVSREAVLVTCV